MPDDELQPRLAAELADETTRLGRELDEIELLIGQARTEATRHEARRSTAEQKLTELQQKRRDAPPDDVVAAQAALLAATRRAALMEGQIDVLEGKQKTVVRMRDRIAELAQQLAGLAPGALGAAGRIGAGGASGGTVLGARVGSGGSGAGVGRPGESGESGASSGGVVGGGAMLIGSPAPTAAQANDAQEELRRGIARAMHDGPAQSLTNITLQAQIVQRLMGTDPPRAAAEVDQLVAMVEHTLEATKSFIFDVRPMVLDDLGLVPTLRRAARDRGRRANVVIDFDSVGADRRLPDDLESALFRCTDEALTGYLEAAVPHITVRLDWTDHDLTTHLTATPPASVGPGGEVAGVVGARAGGIGGGAVADLEPPSADLPPALAAMIAERAEATAASVAKAAAAAAARPAPQLLPAASWRSIQSRAAAGGIRATLTDAGATLTLAANLPA